MNTLFNALLGSEHLEEYVSGVFSDSLDKLGFKRQVIPGWRSNCYRPRMFGKAKTVLLESIETENENIHTGLNFLASLETDDVMIVKGSSDFAYFGELMSRLAQERGIQGVIIDGLTRDSHYTKSINLPIFTKGYSPVDIKGRGRVKDVNVTVTIDGIIIRPGDYIFGDSDAVVVIPKDLLPLLKLKVTEAVKNEVGIKRMIAEGKSIQEILVDHKEF